MERNPDFDIYRPSAERMDMVAGDKIVQQVLRERESFARQVAATKTKARFLVWLGFLMVAGGGTAFMIPFLQAMKESNASTVYDPFASGPSIGGYPAGVLGFAIGFIGQFVLVAGIILHIVAASRRKSLLHLPPPDAWRYSGKW
jgi:hypothetical protein